MAKPLIDLAFKPIKFERGITAWTFYAKQVYGKTSFPGSIRFEFRHKDFKNFKSLNHLPYLIENDYGAYKSGRYMRIPCEPHYAYIPANRKRTYDEFEYVRVYDIEKWENGILIGPRQNEAKNYNKWINDIKIGDFVRCSGQRNTRVWKKIVEITDDSIVCHQYIKPIDNIKYFQGYSSTNLIHTIREKHIA